ncbi:diguanylate cyclase/phosphodiesterase with PAS/PAC sensor [Paraburkholderia caribensis MBA4]|uniref:Diguanylate cyclase/phosphodiesterase with PAS/PAC sensor n=1 Tax=Paraburkholderia caribensis MBA4 TaxID=1323664 RepID=A0A0P0RJW8_9BURK|nr:diguanylate cyclase [Paraburkholderia caribensis]ALL68939.1 diguanylate cyclase/phosphodiesterase with PAS/PAC sensor [Paraburkholderia caribensis MBA4]
MKTVARLYRHRIITVLVASALLVAILAFGGMLGLSRLEEHINTVLRGNALPVAQLDDLRVASTDFHHQLLTALLFQEKSITARSIAAIRTDIERMKKAWSDYYPAGVSGPREEILAFRLKSDLARVLVVLDRNVDLLQAEDYAKAIEWHQENIKLFSDFDKLIDEDIETNVIQATQLTGDSAAILKWMFWTVLACAVVCIASTAALLLYLSRQRDNAVGDSLYQSWLTNRVFELTLDGIMVTDAKGKIQRVNPAFTRLTGYAQGEILGQTPRILSSGRQTSEFYREFWTRLKESGRWQGELWNRRKGGDIYLESLTVAGVCDRNGAYSHYVAIMSDITQRYQHETRLKYLATHDPLTGLPNRMLLEERLKQAISRAKRHSKCVALMMLDLDGFKEINDTHGHALGDEVLKTVAERLTRAVRESDTVARLGGDEFMLVLEDIWDTSNAIPIAKLLVERIGAPISIDGCDVHVTPSIGIGIYPEHGTESDRLCKCADQAMYEAKNAGKNQFRFFNNGALGSLVESVSR